jgi:hypothetical protein
MTLGQYIDYLESRRETLSPETVLPIGLGNPHSWRGAYEELAFEPVADMTLEAMIKIAKEAVNKTFAGYKGGEFQMSRETRIHIDYHGQWSDGGLLWGVLLELLMPSRKKDPRPKPLKSPMIQFSKAPQTAAIELIDGAYDLVETYKPEGPYNIQWRQAWLSKARELGAGPDW